MYAFQVWGMGACRLGCSVRLGSSDDHGFKGLGLAY